MKRIISLVLTIVMVISVFTSMPLTVFASSGELIDVDIYKAQCVLGIANDEHTNAVSLCHNIFVQYNGEDIFSASEAILDAVKEDKKLMMNLTEWKAYSLAAEPSTALDTVLKRKDYYETLLFAIMLQSLSNNVDLETKLGLEAANISNDILGQLCSVAGVDTIEELKIRYPDMSLLSAKEAFNSAIERMDNAELGSELLGNLGLILGFSSTVVDAAERLSVYGTMYKLDLASKQWLQAMYDYCDGSTDYALKDAILNLKASSASFAANVMVDIKDTSFRLANWTINTSIDATFDIIASTNPILISVRAGFKLGKTVCDLFFCTSDVCEQLYLLECVSEVQDLSRKVMNIAGGIFLDSQSSTNAQTFLNAIDFYFNSIINVEIDCTKNFLNLLYNGGVFKGFIVWLYGASNDYGESIENLNGFQRVRADNYEKMMLYPIVALKANYPETYESFYLGLNNSNNNSGSIGGNIGQIQEIEVTDVDFCYKKVDLILNESFRNHAKTSPARATIGVVVEYYSSNENIVTVDSNGVITAVGEGTANVIARTSNGIEDICEVTVYSFRFQLNETGYTIVDYLGSSNNVVIPETFRRYSVTEIGNLRRDNIETVSLSNRITSISNNAFAACKNLVSIDLGSNLKNIGDYAFQNCLKLTSISIPDSVISIGQGAFEFCESLESIKVPKKVAYLGDYAFRGCCNLSSIILDCEMDNIGDFVFYDCTKLEAIDIPNTVINIGAYAFNGCENLFKVTLSNNLKKIDESAFRDCVKLSSITIPDSLIDIGRTAFYGCLSLGTVSFGSNLTNIGDYAFSGCKALLSVTIPDSVTSIGEYAFFECSKLKNVVLSKNLIDIEHNIFAKCSNLSTITIPYGVTQINDGAFSECTQLSSVYIPSSVKNIESFAFQGCNNVNKVIIDDVASWSKIKFSGSSSNPLHSNANLYLGESIITDLFIPGGVEAVSGYAFVGCNSINSVIIGNGVEEIGASCFSGCKNLREITIPGSVTNIESAAFARCYNLSTVNVTDIKKWCEISFADEYSSNPLYPYENEFSKTLKVNGQTVSSINIPNGTSKVSLYAFYGCSNIKSISIPESVVTIGSSGFKGCVNLQEFVVDKNNKYFSSNDGVLYNKEESTLLFYPGGKGGYYITPSTVKTISDEAFYNCNKLESITINDNITNIGPQTFFCCSNLSSVKFGDKVVTIDELAFYGCSALTSIIIPKNVEYLAQGSFYGCSNLSQIMLNNSEVIIEEGAFYKCAKSVDMYGFKNSTAEDYANTNNFEFIPINISSINNLGNSIDYFSRRIVIDSLKLSDLNGLFSIDKNTTIKPIANNNGKYIGTGMEVVVSDKEYGDYTFTCVVKNDTNGDGVCDALDAAQVALVSNGHKSIDGAYKVAADSNSDDIVDIDDYQAIVNKAVS